MRTCTEGRPGRPQSPNKPERVSPVRVIVEVQEDSRHTTLVVSEPWGANQTVQFAAAPREPGGELPRGARPLAVRFDMSDRPPKCSCLVTTPGGPRRIEVSTASGLSLVASGVHGILSYAPGVTVPEGAIPILA